MSHRCPVCLGTEPVVAEAERGCVTRVRRAFVEDPAGAALAASHAIRGVPTFLLLDARGGGDRSSRRGADLTPLVTVCADQARPVGRDTLGEGLARWSPGGRWTDGEVGRRRFPTGHLPAAGRIPLPWV